MIQEGLAIKADKMKKRLMGGNVVVELDKIQVKCNLDIETMDISNVPNVDTSQQRIKKL